MLEAFPTAVVSRDLDECLPLHLLCSNPACTELHIAQLMSFASKFAPDSLTVWAVISREDAWLQQPLHRLCANSYIYPELIECLIQLHPAAVMHCDGRGWSPLQHLLRNASWMGGKGAGAKKVRNPRRQ